jgi:hypothetical protein
MKKNTINLFTHNFIMAEMFDISDNPALLSSLF